MTDLGRGNFRPDPREIPGLPFQAKMTKKRFLDTLGLVGSVRQEVGYDWSQLLQSGYENTNLDGKDCMRPLETSQWRWRNEKDWGGVREKGGKSRLGCKKSMRSI